MTPDFHESRQVERNYTDAMAKKTRGIVVTDETQAKYDAWEWGKGEQLVQTNKRIKERLTRREA